MRLIDADALKYTQTYEPCGNGQYKAVNIVYETDIDAAPTIDPVKHGKWIKIVDCNTVQCSECFEDFDYIDGICYLCHGQELPDYCPNCGAKMDDDWEEPEINPCRGCDDYDGRGGCKSHGGCGAERSE